MVIIRVKKRLSAFTLDACLSFGREIVILTGPNGSGKSTLLRAVAGLVRPDDGSIAVEGHILFDGNVCLPPEERKVGYVCQGGALFPWLTVEKNVLFGLRRNDRSRSLDWLGELYVELDIEHLLNRYPAGLSGGETQRVAIARALAPRPGMLLLDEPFSAVDSKLRPKLRSFLKDVQKEWKIPVLMVSHDYAEANVLGKRVFEIVEGRIMTGHGKERLTRSPLVSY